MAMSQHQIVELNSASCAEVSARNGSDIILSNATAVRDTKLLADGSLQIVFADGAMLIVRDYSSTEVRLSDANGMTVNLAMSDDIVVPTPAAGQEIVVHLQDGNDYVFNFSLSDPFSTDVTEQGALIISFSDGGKIVIPDYQAAVAAHADHQITLADGAVLTNTDLLDVLAAAQSLNDIETAAGGGRSGGGGGYGFQSVFASTDFVGENPIGPIGATELTYQTFQREPLYEQIDAGASQPVIPPLLVSNEVIKEDTQGQVNIIATPTNAGDVLTITVSGFEPGWTVDTSASGGTYDPATGIWTITLPAGQGFNGGPFVTPPANSDIDLNGLVVTAASTSTDGVVTTSTASFDIVVDAVADAPSLSVADIASQYWYYLDTGYAVPLHVDTAVTDNDGSEVVTMVMIDLNQPFTSPAGDFTTLASMGVTLNMGTEVSPGVWQINVNAQNGNDALNGLALIVPNDQDYNIIHQSVTGGHEVTIPVTSYSSEVNTSGQEPDTGDNGASTNDDAHFSFFITPLVLDLDGDGIELVGQSHGISFDMTNDGILDSTTWVAADDGMLAIDLNNDGVINNQSELFGNNATANDGFANLAGYDSNNDGVIDHQDAVFAELLVWQDLNQDGISQADEMHSLTDLGIASISLATTQGGEQIADGQVYLNGSFTYENGEQGQMADVLFSVDAGVAMEMGDVLSDQDHIAFASDMMDAAPTQAQPALSYDAGSLDVSALTAAEAV